MNIKNIALGLVGIAFALALPFDTFLINFNLWSATEIAALQLALVGGSILSLISGVFGR